MNMLCSFRLFTKMIDQIKRLVSKSIVPCTNRKLGIFKATMSTKGTDKHRAPLFR